MMAKNIPLLVFLTYLLTVRCQEGADIVEEDLENKTPYEGNPSYSFSYGVSDARTGDVKTVWESKKGDTVKGHYSVLEPDGSMRTVEYLAGPRTGFRAVVKNDGVNPEPQILTENIIEDKSMKDYMKVHDISEDFDYEFHGKKRQRHPFDTVFKDYSHGKRPKYPIDLEPSEYTHSITIKHPYDETAAGSEPQSHIGFNFDPNCKTKVKKEHNNGYQNAVELELSRPKYPIDAMIPSNNYKDDYERYGDNSDYDIQKVISPYNTNYKGQKSPEVIEKPQSNKYKDSRPIYESDNYPYIPDIPTPVKFYPEDIPVRPKKKYKPYRRPEYNYPNDDLDDYILVPKKKYKTPPRIVELEDYQHEEEEYDRPHYPIGLEDQDDRYHSPPRAVGPKEVVRKIVKKRKPVINLLDIFDL